MSRINKTFYANKIIGTFFNTMCPRNLDSFDIKLYRNRQRVLGHTVYTI